MNIQSLLRLLHLYIICCKYQEVELIKRLSEHFNFDHHFYIIDSSADTDRYVDPEGVTPRSLYVLKSADNDTELNNVREINSKNSFLIVVPGSSQLDRNSQLLLRMKIIQRLQINMKIGVFFSPHSSMEDLHEFFGWCKKNLIVNIFAATHPSSEIMQTENSINIFTFDPFGKFEVLNVTNSETYDGFFLSQKSNFQQHQFQVGSKPYFNYRGENLWETIFRRMNATFTQVDFDLVYHSEVDDGFDVLSYLTYQDKLQFFNVYPEKITYVVIIIPKALPYSEFSAYLLNATSGELGIYCLTLFVAVIVVLCILRYMKRKKTLFFQSTVDVCNLLMNDNGSIKYQKLCRSENFVIVPLTFVGLIVTNGILSNLKSYVTRPISQHQINTLEEIYSSEFPIYTKSQSWLRLSVDVLSNRTGKDWSRKIFKDETNYLDNMLTYSQNMSFIYYPKFTDIVLNVQKRFEIKAYHNPDIRICYFYWGYLVNETFLYFERLNDIIHRMKSAGLNDLLERQEQQHIENVFKGDVIRLRNNIDTGIVVNDESFEFPMFLFYGWAAGFVVLILEIIWKHLEFPPMKKIYKRLLGKILGSIVNFKRTYFVSSQSPW